MSKLTQTLNSDPKSKPGQRPKTGDQSAAPTKPETDEIGGPKGPEPTRFGDWEQKGRCSDF